jgi:hypothetical protein
MTVNAMRKLTICLIVCWRVTPVSRSQDLRTAPSAAYARSRKQQHKDFLAGARWCLILLRWLLPGRLSRLHWQSGYTSASTVQM